MLRNNRQPMKNYFAYGSNLLRSQMELRCPDHIFVGVATLQGHRFLIGERGFATVAEDGASRVSGALYRISETDEASLDLHEGVARGSYRKAIVAVVSAGSEVHALTYIDDRIAPARPRAGYLEKIAKGAAERGLPPDYIAFLCSFDRLQTPTEIRGFNRRD